MELFTTRKRTREGSEPIQHVEPDSGCVREALGFNM